MIPNSEASKIEHVEDAFHLHFDNDIIELIVQHTSNKILETIARHQENNSFQEYYCWMRPADKAELEALFGLMYFRGLLGVNLLGTEKLFSNESHYVFGAIMSKNRFKFLKSHLLFDDPEERKTLWDNDRFAAMKEVGELFN